MLLGLLPLCVFAQSDVVLDPDVLFEDLADDWTTYSGDYTGKRYSRLTQIDKDNVKNLTLAWTAEMNYSVRGATTGFNPFAGRGSIVTNVGGEGTGEIEVNGGAIKGTLLEVDGILYFTVPDHAWALVARDGSELWH
jgi:alcohol dehydrogenase (cytochrome c)